MHIYNPLSVVLIGDKNIEDTDKVYINILCGVDNLDIFRELYTKRLRVPEDSYTRGDRDYARFRIEYFYIRFIKYKLFR